MKESGGVQDVPCLQIEHEEDSSEMHYTQKYSAVSGRPQCIRGCSYRYSLQGLDASSDTFAAICHTSMPP